MRSSQAAVDLIVAEEVSSKAVYTVKYQQPEWPGLQSGITVGIGYDLAYSDKEKISSDWSPYLPASMVTAMQSVSGLKGQQAAAMLPHIRPKVLIPWGAAIAVFERNDMPRWEAIVERACPGSDLLPAGCFGAIVSIAYNRGASFSKSGDRFAEMRGIKALIQTGNWSAIPAQIRSMKRLWPSTKGLRDRREREAVLFERSLEASRSAEVDDRNYVDVTLEGNEQPEKAAYSAEVELLQTKLVGFKYHEVGETDGKWGGKTRGAVVAFMTDRHKSPDGLTTPFGFANDTAKATVLGEISKAATDNWTRPIAEARATATAADIAPKVASVNITWYQKVWAYLLGVPSFLIAGFKGLFGDQAEPSGYIATIKDIFSSVPVEYYALATLGIAAAVLIAATKSQNATVKAYQNGEIN